MRITIALLAIALVAFSPSKVLAAGCGPDGKENCYGQGCSKEEIGATQLDYDRTRIIACLCNDQDCATPAWGSMTIADAIDTSCSEFKLKIMTRVDGAPANYPVLTFPKADNGKLSISNLFNIMDRAHIAAGPFAGGAQCINGVSHIKIFSYDASRIPRYVEIIPQTLGDTWWYMIQYAEFFISEKGASESVKTHYQKRAVVEGGA